MDKKKLARAQELNELVEYHKVLYENGEPEITDSEYDQLYLELRGLLEELGMDINDSAIATITAPTKSVLPKVKHESFIGSLTKATTEKEIVEFVKTLPSEAFEAHVYLNLEPKCDGLTIVATYNNGKLVRAVTRGDGEWGEDVTANVKMIQGIPETISYTGKVILRFEAMISKEAFETINEDGNYSNARNLVAGTIRQTNPQLVVDRQVFGEVFDVLYLETGSTIDAMVYEPIQKRYIADQFNCSLELFNNATRYARTISLAGWKDMREELGQGIYRTIQAMKEDKLAFGTDGIVVKVMDEAIRAKMGERFNNPRWAIAFKFPSKNASSILNDVKFTVGRTGKVTPVAEFDEVVIDNVAITKATLHNENIIKAKKLHYGDNIIVSRRNDVIPAIEASTKYNGGADIEIPTVCPECGTKLIKKKDTLMCPNHYCRARVIAGITAWCSKTVANIKGLSTNRIISLYDAGIIHSVADIYTIPEVWESILELPGWGPDILASIIEEITTSKASMPLAKFIQGLGIPQVGRFAAAGIERKFKTLANFVSLKDSKDLDTLKELPMVGEVIAQEIIDFLVENEADVAQLASCVTVIDKEELAAAPGQSLAGLKVCFTGTLSHPRRYYEEKAESAGAIISNSVTRDLDYLVVGDAPGSKLDKAMKYGVATLSEVEFLKKIK